MSPGSGEGEVEGGQLGSPWLDRGLFCAVFGAYLLLLVGSVDGLGYARDEGFYFEASQHYLKWFELLLQQPSAALERVAIDRAWRVNHEHPALIKSLFAACHALLYRGLGVFEEPGTALRFGGMLLSSLAVGMVFLWGRQLLSRGPALVGALSFGLMPRVFYHAHLACFDMPVAAMWLLTSYVYWRSFHSERWGLRIAAGLLYGLLLNTKHNSWLLPFVLLAHLALVRGPALLHAVRRRTWPPIPPALWLMALLGPPVFYAGWPWLWPDPVDRFVEYAKFHLGHVYYNMEFLGQTYWKPPMPRGYAWLMTLATVPAITLLLAAVGGATLVVPKLAHAFTGLRAGASNVPLAGHAGVGPKAPAEPSAAADRRASALWLWLVSIVVSYAPWWSNQAPIFGGTKHWITAYPFLALLGAVGFEHVLGRLRALAVRRRWVQTALPAGLALSVLMGPLALTAHSHPWGLSAYTPLVGGSVGAANLGLNRTFWGYTTGALADVINQHAPKDARVFVHDTALQSWDLLVRDGKLRPDLKPSSTVSGTTLGLYHHEPHMGRVEYMLWTDYGTVQPLAMAGLDGVPVVWLYERPRAEP